MPDLLATTATRLRLMLLAGDRGRIVAGDGSVKGSVVRSGGCRRPMGGAPREPGGMAGQSKRHPKCGMPRRIAL